MQQVVTAEQMRSFDTAAIETYGIPGLILMENAGRAFVDALAARYGSLEEKRVLVVCGKGNNGGDGFVIARHCVNRGARVEVALLADPAQLKGDARTNFEIISRMAGTRLAVATVRTAEDLSLLHDADILVDAIFGTGFSGEVTGLNRDAIGWINSRPWQVASVDIASGVSADDGSVGNVAVHAATTVTMGLGKIGHYVGEGMECAGGIVIADLSIPFHLLENSAPVTQRVHASDVAAILPRRSIHANKYSIGKVYVVAGSRNFTGAPGMTAQSALVGGAGAVVLGSPDSVHATLASKLTEVIIQPLPETREGTIAAAAEEMMLQRIAWADVVVIGPGLARNSETDRLLLSMLPRIDKPVVLDADGLNALAGHTDVLAFRSHDTILTPHAGELGRLTGEPARDIERRRVQAAREAAAEYKCVVVLKGAPTATALPDGTVYLNTTGNPGMASVGTGDVLTGIIAALRAQGADTAAAAYGGVFLHGMAGDLGAAELGERSLLASDIIGYLPAAFTTIEREPRG